MVAEVVEVDPEDHHRRGGVRQRGQLVHEGGLAMPAAVGAVGPVGDAVQLVGADPEPAQSPRRSHGLAGGQLLGRQGGTDGGDGQGAPPEDVGGLMGDEGGVDPPAEGDDHRSEGRQPVTQDLQVAAHQDSPTSAATSLMSPTIPT
jgi:hypothetical protein